MQQWLNLIPMVGALFNLSAAMTNLAITIINRRGTTSNLCVPTTSSTSCDQAIFVDQWQSPESVETCAAQK